MRRKYQAGASSVSELQGSLRRDPPIWGPHFMFAFRAGHRNLAAAVNFGVHRRECGRSLKREPRR
eukprot:8627752-Pyramimonas_sp.AAC.1